MRQWNKVHTTPLPPKATQSNVLVLVIRAYTRSNICPIWCLQLIKAVIINKTDRVDVFSEWSCFTCAVWKPVCTKGLYKSRPYWSATGAFGSVWPKRSARADVATDELLFSQIVESWDRENWPRRSTVDVATKIDLEECWGKSIGDLWRWYHWNLVSILKEEYWVQYGEHKTRIPIGACTLNWLVWKWFKFR